ncbi:MAG: AbrB/MazE/SpoVT family DNA-binding domain-containing protein [Deltaproteobacteria bacterium]|nr:AbrB/MazE/SpoVT family DNA-binding domain-containing protein [Deltaproteobacteria bacterium]
MKSAVSEKGQVTIPKAVRDCLGLRPGTLLEFRAENGRLIGAKSVSEDVFRKWRGRGRLPAGMTVDAYLALARGGRAHRG